MDAAAAAAQLHWMLQMEHFVIDDVLDGITRNALVVEGTADHDGVVRRIVMGKASAGVRLAPCHPRPR